MNQKEVWKDVKNYEGLYQVSNLGRVKSLDRKNWNGKGFFVKEGRYLKQSICSSGYFLVVLCKKNKQTSKRVHRIVAETFLNYNKKDNNLEVDHINDNKKDNRVLNLHFLNGIKHRGKNSSSIFTGVSWSKKSKKWIATATVNKKQKYLGSFINELEAYKVVKEYENQSKCVNQTIKEK